MNEIQKMEVIDKIKYILDDNEVENGCCVDYIPEAQFNIIANEVLEFVLSLVESCADVPEQYEVRISCPDCTGEDFMGCGDGYPWYLEDSQGRPIRYDSYVKAMTDAMKEVEETIWTYEILRIKKYVIK